MKFVSSTSLGQDCPSCLRAYLMHPVIPYFGSVRVPSKSKNMFNSIGISLPR